MKTKMNIKTILYLFIFLFTAVSSSIHGDIPDKERAALIALYKSTNGDNWHNNSGWKDGDLENDGFALKGTETDWYGVNLDENDTLMVLDIDLNGNNLSGTIPSQIGDLTNLVSLYLSNNSLSGTIPGKLVDLTKLEVLNLHSNQLTGISPDLDFSKLAQLTHIFLENNQISGLIPSSLGSLTNLEQLSLFTNEFENEIPAVLGNLTKLTLLDLHDNYLSGAIPVELGSLAKLEKIDISSNKLRGAIPPEIKKLTTLIDNGSDFRRNALYREADDDNSILAFLDSKQVDGNWENTQTIVPTEVRADPIDSSTIKVSWNPIAYLTETGLFSVYRQTPQDDKLIYYKVTPDRTVTEMNVTGLKPGIEYYFAVKSVTQPYVKNRNEVKSLLCDPVHATIVTFTVSGKVATGGDIGIPDVELTFSNDDGDTQINTDKNGEYSHDVLEGWSGTVTPSKDRYAFNPDGPTLTVTGDAVQDFTGDATTPAISGLIADENGTGIRGVTLKFRRDGETTAANIINNDNGKYTHAVDIGWSGKVTPFKTGYTFSDPKTYENVQEDKNGQDYTGQRISPVISGKVASKDDTGIKGVTLTFSNDGGSTNTNSNGIYKHPVAYGWRGTVTPSKTGYTFAPPKKNYSPVTSNKNHQNYIADAIRPVISGYVATKDDRGIDEVTITFQTKDGGKITTTGTNAKGKYSQEVNYGWSGTVIPEKTGYSFAPTEKEYTNVTKNEAFNFEASADSHTISGKVITEQGAPIPEVTLTFSNGGGSTTTGANGRYSQKVNHGWSGTVTPSKSGYTFSAPRTYEKVQADKDGQDYTGEEDKPVIWGTVTTQANTGVPGVVITFTSGDESKSILTGQDGGYEKAVPKGWSGKVTPSKTGYTFTPTHHDYTNVTIDEELNFTASKSISYPDISGQITMAAETGEIIGLSGVLLTFSNDGGITYTRNDGTYENSVDIGWSGTVTPSKDEYAFKPKSLPFTDVRNDIPNQNYTARLADKKISGRVATNTSVGIADVRMTFSNDGGTTRTNSNGDYHMEVSNGWSGTVTPDKEGYRFEHLNLEYSPVFEDKTGQDFTAFKLPGYWTISGKVELRAVPRSPLAGVTLTFGEDGGSAKTNDNGHYSHVVNTGWSGTVTPVKEGFHIPAKRYSQEVTEDKHDQHYTASRSDLKIMGIITTVNDAFPVENVELEFYDDEGTVTYQTQTGEDGTYTQSVQYEWSGTVKPDKKGYRFTPEDDLLPVLTGNVFRNFTAHPSVIIKIEASRETERTMAIQKQYGVIRVTGLTIDMQDESILSKFILKRKVSGTTGWSNEVEIPAGQMGTSYIYLDKYLEQDKIYIYKIVAENTDRLEIGTSNEASI